MNFTITKGTPNADEINAIESALKARKSAPVIRRSSWGKPQLRSELVKNRRKVIGK